MSRFFRFPRIPHLAWLSEGEPRNDKLLSPAEVREFLAAPVVVEEKLDGANLGLSISVDGELQAQNRGQYLRSPYSGQFAPLEAWLAQRGDRVFDALTENLIAFGEWCAARHSIKYDSLPNWWLPFDVYDRQARRFWSTRRRNIWAAKLDLVTTPVLFSGYTDLPSLRHLIETQTSAYSDGPLEGVVVRVETDDWLLSRAKLVRAEFSQHIESHWRSRPLMGNQIRKGRA